MLPKYTRADGCVSQLVQWPLLHYYNTTTDAAAAAGGDGAREAFGRSRSGGSLDSMIPER